MLPDFITVSCSTLTHAIVRKKYLDHIGQENLSKGEKEQLKRLMEEELLQMKVDEPPGDVELRTEVQDSFKSGDRKRPRRISDSSDEETKNEQEQKRQKIGKKLDGSSDEKDSGIDSKKQPLNGGPKLLRKFLDSSDQADSGAEDHSAESGSDEESIMSKGKEPLQEAGRERQRGSKSAQWNRGLQDRAGSESEEATDTEQSDLEEEVEEPRKVTKGNSLNQKDLKLRKKVDKELKVTDPKGKEKNRKVKEQRGGKNKSGGRNDLSEMEKISENKRIEESDSEEEKKSLSNNKAQGKVGQGIRKGSKGSESEDASKSDFDQKCSLQKKMANSRCRRKSIEDLGSSSEDSEGQSPMRNEGGRKASGTRRSQQARNYSKHKRQPKERGRKKMQREDLSRKKLEKEKEESRRSTSEESESEADEHNSLKEKKGMQDSTSSDGESQSQTEKNQGQPRKEILISHPSGSESDESKDGGQRENRMLKKKGKGTSGDDSSQEEDKLKSRGTQKSQRKRVSKKESALDSEDSGSEFGGKKRNHSQQKKRTEKLKRRSTSKEKLGEESTKEEGSSSEEGEPTSNQHHLGKDKKHSGKNEEHPSIQRLKRYIRECGVWRNYKKLLAGCRSRKAQIEVLREELGSLGMKGTPSLAKCKALRQKREEAAEVASLDINNIIATEGRPKRRNVWSLYSKPQESPSSPEELPLRRRRTTDWSQLQGVISSDGESN